MWLGANHLTVVWKPRGMGRRRKREQGERRRCLIAPWLFLFTPFALHRSLAQRWCHLYMAQGFFSWVSLSWRHFSIQSGWCLRLSSENKSLASTRATAEFLLSFSCSRHIYYSKIQLRLVVLATFNFCDMLLHVWIGLCRTDSFPDVPYSLHNSDHLTFTDLQKTTSALYFREVTWYNDKNNLTSLGSQKEIYSHSR